MARRDYDGLTGKEIREKFKLLLDEALAADGRLQDHIAYHNVAVIGEFILQSNPARNEKETFEVSMSVGDPKKAIKGGPKVTEIHLKESLPVPDLVREELEQALSDAEVLTQAETRS